MTRTCVAAALILLTAAGLPADGRAECVSRSEGQQMVAKGQVTPLPVALQNAGLGGAQVLNADLCRSGGGWSYRLRYRRGGQVNSTNIPAS